MCSLFFPSDSVPGVRQVSLWCCGCWSLQLVSLSWCLGMAGPWLVSLSWCLSMAGPWLVSLSWCLGMAGRVFPGSRQLRCAVAGIAASTPPPLCLPSCSSLLPCFAKPHRANYGCPDVSAAMREMVGGPRAGAAHDEPAVCTGRRLLRLFRRAGLE